MTVQLNGSHITVLVLACTLLGCGTAKLNLAVESDVPKPVTKPIPLTLGVYYDDEFREYIYTERKEDREDWRVDNRKARLSMFNGVLSSMFETVETVDKKAASKGASSVAAILEPTVLDMQLALPQETKMEFYEAWLKYELKLYRPEGGLIDRWQVTGYGKALSENVGGVSEGLNTAIDSALRDVGAKLTLGFTKNPGVKNWLCERQKCSDVANQ